MVIKFNKKIKYIILLKIYNSIKHTLLYKIIKVLIDNCISYNYMDI